MRKDLIARIPIDPVIATTAFELAFVAARAEYEARPAVVIERAKKAAKRIAKRAASRKARIARARKAAAKAAKRSRIARRHAVACTRKNPVPKRLVKITNTRTSTEARIAAAVVKEAVERRVVHAVGCAAHNDPSLMTGLEDQLVVVRDAFDPAKIQSVKNDWQKPEGGFWSSTLFMSEGTHQSEWTQWCQSNGDWAAGRIHGCYMYKLIPNADARILHLLDGDDVERFQQGYGHPNSDEFHYDYERLAQAYDAVHFGSNAHRFVGWSFDVESTLWLHPAFTVEPLGTYEWDDKELEAMYTAPAPDPQELAEEVVKAAVEAQAEPAVTQPQPVANHTGPVPETEPVQKGGAEPQPATQDPVLEKGEKKLKLNYQIVSKIRELKLDPEDFMHLAGEKDPVVLWAILEWFAADNGWTDAEARLYALGNRSNGREAGGLTSWENLDAAVRLIRSGLRPFSKKFRNALDSGIIASLGELPSNFHRAIGEKVRVIESIPDLKDCLAEGRTMLVGHKAMLERFSKLMKDRDVLACYYDLDNVVAEVVAECENPHWALRQLLPNATVEGNTVTGKLDFYEIGFDLDAGTVDGKLLLPEVYINDILVPRTKAMVLWAMLASHYGSGAKLRKLTQLAPSCWFTTEEVGYYDLPADHVNRVQNENACGFANVAKWDGILFKVNDSRTVDQVEKAAFDAAERGLPVAFHKQLARCYFRDGALVAGFGLNDAGETVIQAGGDKGYAKLLVRWYTGAKPSARILGDDGSTQTVRSAFGMKLSDGKTAHQYGFKAYCALSNYPLGDNSGVSILNQDFELKIGVTKSATTTVTDNEKVVADLVPGIRAKLGKETPDKLVYETAVKQALTMENELLEYGMPIFYLGGVPRAFFENVAMQGRVVGDPELKYVSGQGVRVKASVEAWYDANASFKAVAPGVKSAFQAGSLFCYDEQGHRLPQASLSFVAEGLKDVKLASANMFANTKRSVTYDANQGYDEADMKDIDAFQAEESTRELWIRDFDDDSYALHKANYERAVADPEWAKAKGLDPERYVWCNCPNRIGYWVDVLRGTMVCAVEVSTEREAITEQPMILEQLVALRTISEKLVERLLKDTHKNRDAIDKALAMAMGRPACNPEGERVDLELHGNYELPALKGRELIQALAKKFPHGVNLVKKSSDPTRPDTVRAVLHFDALESFGAYGPGGTATGIAQVVLNILAWMCAGDVKGWNGEMSRVLRQFNAALFAWATSHGLLAKVARTGKCMFGRKVRPLCSPKLKKGQIGLNPLDPLVSFGFLTDGDFLLVSRTPMIAVFGGTVVIDECFAIGVLSVHSADWTRTNCGDGDGDPCSFLKVDEDLVEEVKANLETSPFGPRGYVMSFGADITEQPYADFFRKAIADQKNPAKAKFDIRTMNTAEYIEMAGIVGRHYQYFVGGAFAVCSYLTLLIGKKLDAGDVIPDSLYLACILAWEVYYEDLGLAGYTPNAGAFAESLRELKRRGIVTLANQMEYERAIAEGFRAHEETDKDSNEKVFWLCREEAFRWAWYCATGVKLDADTAEYLELATQVTGLYGTLENDLEDGVSPVEVVSAKRPHLRGELLGVYVTNALIFGTLRRGSKGLGIGRFVQEDEDSVNCMFTHLTSKRLALLPEGMLKDTLVSIIRVQKTARKVEARAEQLASINQ